MTMKNNIGRKRLCHLPASCIQTLVCLFVVSMMCFGQNTHAAVWQITYPKSLVENDDRETYPLAVLKLALDKTGVRYNIKASEVPIRQSRAIKRLEENLEINVFWSMTDVQREQSLLPIRIPIDKGLLGWRMLLAHNKHEIHSQTIQNIEQLKQFSAIQGLSWPDTKILQANGFNVLTGRDYLECRALTIDRSGDFFPRSLIEIQREMNRSNANALRIKEGMVISYPSAMYFFVNKQNKTLARLIETGLEKAISDGSFNALFHVHFDDTIRQLNIHEARRFELTNPLLPVSTPTHRSELWYTIHDSK